MSEGRHEAEAVTRTMAAHDTSIDAVLKFEPPRAGIAVRNVAMHLMPLVNGAQRQGILFRGYLCEMKNAPPAAGNTVGASSPVTGG